MRHRVLVFDAAGTLIHPDPPVATVYATAAARHGLVVSEDHLRLRFRRILRGVIWGRGNDQTHRAIWREIVAQVFERPAERLEPLFEELWDHFAQPSAWDVYPDVVEHWPRLLDSYPRVAIASNFDGRLRQILVGHGLWIDEATFWSSALGCAKPEGHFFKQIEHRLEASPYDCLMVGDDPHHDYHAARKAGWSALLLDRQARFASDDLRTIRCCGDL